MPTYLCHGFRWHRHAIRLFVILHDLEDAAADWIIGPATSSLILSQLYDMYKFLPEVAVSECTPVPKLAESKRLHPDDDLSLPPLRVSPSQDHVLMHSWSAVKLLEEHDPEDLSNMSRPYAYLADYVVRVDLSVDVAAEMARYESRPKEENEWLERLRDEVQKGGEIGWFVVVCGDELREFGQEEEDDDSDEVGSQDTERGVLEPAQQTSLPIREAAAGQSEDPSLRDSMAPPASAYTIPTLTRPNPPSGHISKPQVESSETTGSTAQPQDESITPDKQATEAAVPHAQESTSPKLKKKRSRAAGLRRLFKKKDDSKEAQ